MYFASDLLQSPRVLHSVREREINMAGRRLSYDVL